MKFIKALNSGIVTDLGLGNQVYKITTEGCEVEDSVAAKLKEIFGHHVEVTDIVDAEVKDETPGMENPVKETPAPEVESTEPKVEEVPAEEIPVEETPADSTATEETA